MLLFATSISREEIYFDEPLPQFSGNWLSETRIEQSMNWPLPRQEEAHHFEFAFFDMEYKVKIIIGI